MIIRVMLMMEWQYGFSLSLNDHQVHILEMILMDWKWNYYFIMEYNNYNYNWNNLLRNGITKLKTKIIST